MKEKATGWVTKTYDGTWDAYIVIRDGSHNKKYTTLSHKRMKDAMEDCNQAAKLLGWEVDGWEKV